MENALTAFVQHAREKGMDHATIRMVLLSAGWKEKDVAEAITAQSLDLAVPMPPDSGGAREAFNHLLVFSTLLATLGSLILLYFTYIERLFPDLAIERSWYDEGYEYSSIRWSLAVVLVAFPLFMWLSRLMSVELRRHPEKSWSGIRRWLTYLTLFLAAGAMAGDVISLVFVFLEGELSARFLLKVFVVLTLAGATFMYYLLSLRLSPGDASARRVQFGFPILAIAVTATAVVWGAMIVGSPGMERQRKFDARRIEHLDAIAAEIHEMVFEVAEWEQNKGEPKHPLPATLDEIIQHGTHRGVLIAEDPETGQLYRYVVTGKNTFKLCAKFGTVRDRKDDIFWNHPAGEHCYEFDLKDWP